MRKLGRKRLPAAYRYAEDLGPEEWAWEFLRRDLDYRAAVTARPTYPPDRDTGRRWGLSFRREPRSPGG
jgi:hypothetical protein